jgi:hypothetical protein
MDFAPPGQYLPGEALGLSVSAAARSALAEGTWQKELNRKHQGGTRTGHPINLIHCDLLCLDRRKFRRRWNFSLCFAAWFESCARRTTSSNCSCSKNTLGLGVSRKAKDA